MGRVSLATVRYGLIRVYEQTYWRLLNALSWLLEISQISWIGQECSNMVDGCRYVISCLGIFEGNDKPIAHDLHICVRPLRVARSTNRAMREPLKAGRVTGKDSHAFFVF